MNSSNFTKKEKHFWQKHFRIEKANKIFTDWTIYKSVDGNEDDDFFYYFTLRVQTITEIYLKQTLITDKALAYFTNFKSLKHLYLRKHQNITKKSLAFINKMDCLETLNITKTKITLSDLIDVLNNKTLKEVFLDSEENETEIQKKAFILKERMPNCNIYLNCSYTTDSFGNIENPIY